MKIDGKLLVRIIDATGADAQKYSGRGMYGRHCVAIPCDGAFDMLTVGADLCSAAESITDTAEEALDLVDAVADLMRHAQTDQLGFGHIVYWPCIEWPEEVAA